MYHFNEDNIPSNSSYKSIKVPKLFFGSIASFFGFLYSSVHAILFCKYDLINVHNIDCGFILPILKLKYKVFSTLHGRPQLREKWGYFYKLFFNISEKFILRLSNKIICVSYHQMEFYKDKYKMNNLSYIPNGINLNEEVADQINFHQYGIKHKQYISFAAGRIIPSKGLNDLLKAYKFKSINKELLIIGQMNEIKSYKQKIKLNLNNDLHFFSGFIKNKKDLLGLIKKSILFIFPSHYEAMSMMLLEVASIKTPIICSDIPENKILFNDNEVLYYKVNNHADLNQKINWAINNYDEMQEKAENSYNKLIDKYSWANISERYNKILIS